MSKFEEITYFYKPGMGRGVKMMSSKYQEEVEESINERFLR